MTRTELSAEEQAFADALRDAPPDDLGGIDPVRVESAWRARRRRRRTGALTGATVLAVVTAGLLVTGVGRGPDRGPVVVDEVATVVVPPLVGRPLPEARELLSAAGLTRPPVVAGLDEGDPRVVDQRPAGGTELPADGRVEVVVAPTSPLPTRLLVRNATDHAVWLHLTNGSRARIDADRFMHLASDRACAMPLEVRVGGQVIDTYDEPCAGQTWTITDDTSWPVNEKGDTFGSPRRSGFPDLIAVVATNGRRGFVYASVFGDAPMPSSPEEALAQQEESQGRGLGVPVFESDGETLVGEFVIRR